MVLRYTNHMSTWHNSVCPHDCPSACALSVEKLDGARIGRVRGGKHNPYTDGVICAKVSKYVERAHHPARLLRPLLRVRKKTFAMQNNGAHNGANKTPATAANLYQNFAEIGWDEALDLVAEKFQAAAKEFGAESVWPYYYGGTMGLVQRDGIVRLTRAMGYSQMQKTICTQIAYDGWRAGAGVLRGADARELAMSDLIIVWGCNAAATQINVMHHIAKARKRGAKLVVVDPYENATAKVADMHLAPRPGTDGALACAVMHYLFKHGKADRGYLKKYTRGADKLAQHLQTRDAKWAADLTGLDADEITAFAKLYGATKKSYIRLGIGFSRQRNGAVNVHAVSCLPAVTGAWKYKGGGALLATSDAFQMNEELIQGLDIKSDARVLDMSQIGAILCGDSIALQNGPAVRAMLIQNTNPMLVAPELAAVRRGFAREDLFVCVHEQFMTETAALADVILPATMFIEHDDVYRSYGHTFLQIGEQIIAPPGGAKPNHFVICELAKRLGAAHRGFNLSELELADVTLAMSNYPPRGDFVKRHMLDCAPAFRAAHFLDGFGWPDKKFRFAPDWPALGPYGKTMPKLPDHWDVLDRACDEYPLRLIAAPSRGYLNSTFTQSPSSVRRERQPCAQIHPATAKKFGVEDGARVQIGNRRGAVTVTAKHRPRVNADSVIVEGIWPASAFPENIGINLLISAAPAAPNGGAVFHDTAVWIKPA